jgi:hypothetical protein
MQRTAATRPSQITFWRCRIAAQPVHAVGEKIERELAAKARNVISRSGVAKKTPRRQKIRDRPERTIPKILAELLYALAVPHDYR